MEQLNRIDVRGYVGSVAFYTNGDRPMARFTVATSYAYKDKDGGAVIETTWHNVVAWEGRGIRELDKIGKGSKIFVSGRLRNQKYTAADGTEHASCEIFASKLALIEGEEPFQYEM